MIAAITGANGFIGQHLVRRFSDAGWDVRPIVRGDFESGAIDSHVRRADVVVHAAGATRAPTTTRLRASNVDLTARALEAARRGGASRFVLISSQAAAGPASSIANPVSEAMAPAPVESYGRSKLDAEAIVLAQSDVPVVVLRPAAVYGPGDRDFLTMFRLARHGVAIHPSNREHWLSIVHVTDLAEGVLGCSAGAPSESRVYFLSNDEPVQWADLFRMGAACAGRTLWMDVNVPHAMMRIGALIGDAAARLIGRASLLTGEKLALSRPTYWVCSNERARREFGFAPRIDLHHGLREAYHWYVEHGWL